VGIMKIVSACLAGIKCRWNGENDVNEKIKEMVEKREAIAFCPEVLGDLAIPRKSCGVYGGLGEDVLNNKATVRTIDDGEDLTEHFLKGANEFLKIAKSKNIKEAVLRTPSPSCGCGKTWQLDDKFVNHVVDGDGVTAALLKKNGIKVYTEENFK
jgi:uncharacterized protein YbbK (DUF523 family)